MTMTLSSFLHLKNNWKRRCKLVLYAVENQKGLTYFLSLTSSSREEQEEKEATKGTRFTGFEDFCLVPLC